MMIFDDCDGDDDFEKADGQHPLCKTNVGAAAGGAACKAVGGKSWRGHPCSFCAHRLGRYANRRHIVPHTT